MDNQKLLGDEVKTALSVLNSACEKKTYQSFKDLPVGEYIVNHFSIVETKLYGNRIRIDLGETYMLLPKRFAEKLDQEKINVLNKSPKVMVYGGKDSSFKDRLILQFREAAYYAEIFNFDVE